MDLDPTTGTFTKIAEVLNTDSGGRVNSHIIFVRTYLISGWWSNGMWLSFLFGVRILETMIDCIRHERDTRGTSVAAIWPVDSSTKHKRMKLFKLCIGSGVYKFLNRWPTALESPGHRILNYNDGDDDKDVTVAWVTKDDAITGVSGNNVLDSNGDREPDYWITDMDPSTGIFVKVAEVANTDSGGRVNITTICLNHFPNHPNSISIDSKWGSRRFYTGRILVDLLSRRYGNSPCLQGTTRPPTVHVPQRTRTFTHTLVLLAT